MYSYNIIYYINYKYNAIYIVIKMSFFLLTKRKQQQKVNCDIVLIFTRLPISGSL